MRKPQKVSKTFQINSQVDKDVVYILAYDERDAIAEFFRCIGPIPASLFKIKEISAIPKKEIYLNSGVLARNSETAKILDTLHKKTKKK